MSANPQLPDYVASAQPNPKSNRVGWLTSTAATYAGIMLWFVFWQDVPAGSTVDKGSTAFSNVAGGMLSQGLGPAIFAVIVAALLCHFLFYLVPGLLGMKTGLPLYIVGTSTYGVQGGFIMPGFLMGCLQFGWLAVNSYFSAMLLVVSLSGPEAINSALHLAIGVIWAIVAAFVGLKGIQYVGRVASLTPIIPFAILLFLVVKTMGGLGDFDPKTLVAATEGKEYVKVTVGDDESKEWRGPVKAEDDQEAEPTTDGEGTTPPANETETEDDEATPADEPVATTPGAEGSEGEAGPTGEAGTDADAAANEEVIATIGTPVGFMGAFLIITAYIVGFFATAGAAGADFGMNNEDEKAVQMGGLVGVAGATIFTGICALLIVAGASGMGIGDGMTRASGLFEPIAGGSAAKAINVLLVIAAFPPACFSSFIAANSFKTTLPKVNPFISCGVGTLFSILLVVSTLAGQAAAVFTVIGASFGPICGAMAADYIKSGMKWAGPRAGFNPAGWISWAVGFAVGGWDLVAGMTGVLPVLNIPCPPMAAFIVGFVLYYVLAAAGLESQTLEMPGSAEASTEEETAEA